MTKVYFVFFSFLIASFVFSQEQKNDIIQQRVEFISEQLEDEEIDLTGLFENLVYFFDHPINLNMCSQEDLEELGGLLTDIQINNLLNHRATFGKLITIYELQSLKYWDLPTIFNVLPFVKVTDRLDQPSLSLRELLKQGKSELYLRYQRNIEDRSGYANVSDSIKEQSNQFYKGSADKLYSRYRFSYRTNFSVGLTAEKDAGEQFFKGSNPNGFDFYSAHAYYSGGKFIKKVALGDYQMQMGQALTFWTGYAFGKTADAVTVKKNARGLRPYTSVDESRFLRGAGIEFGLGNFSITTFASHKAVDASIVADTLSNEEGAIASAINVTGLHRTNSELARRDALKETIAGTYLKYNTRKLQIGLSAVHQCYDKAFERAVLPYNQFDFRGKELNNFGADYSFINKNFNLFGEVALSSTSNSIAFIQGLLIAIDSRATISAVLRKYPKDYHTFYAIGFGETATTRNESGFYMGTNINVAKHFKVNGYVDFFKFPWLRFQIDAPSVGQEVLGQLTYKPNKKLQVYVRAREQQRARNSRDYDNPITPIETVTQRNYRINLAYKLTDELQWKSRLEYVTINRKSNSPEQGMILTQDLLWKPKKFPVDISLRYALFDTDSFDSRIYSFENNALYVFSVPAYFYTGSRAYALIRWSFLRKCDLWVRYSTSIFANRDSIGSGPEEVLGNTRSDITVQFRVKF